MGAALGGVAARMAAVGAPVARTLGRGAGRSGGAVTRLFRGKPAATMLAPTTKTVANIAKGTPLGTIATVAGVGLLALPLARRAIPALGGAAGRLARRLGPRGVAGVGGALAGGAVVGGGALLAGRGGGEMGQPGGFLGGIFDVQPPQALAPGVSVAYSWNTGTATFYRLTDGRIAVRRKNGIWKVWRPQKHIVVSRNPRTGTLIKADKRIDKLMRGLARRMPAAARKPARRKVCG